MNDAPRLAYLVSQYPAVSHTFILREVCELKSRGFTISVSSVNPPDRPLEHMTATERAEALDVWYIKSQGIRGALQAMFAGAVKRPAKLLGGLKAAFRLGGLDIRRTLYFLAYWVEAVMVGIWMEEQGLTHLHVHFATPAASVGLLTKVMFPIGFSFTVHGPDEFYNVQDYRLKEKIALADFVLCISHYARSQMMKISPVDNWSKFEISRLGVNTDSFLFREDKLPGEFFELLCVGRLVSAKGQHILLDAFASLVRQDRRVRLTLVGQGPDAESLKAHADLLEVRDFVRFTGAVNQDEIHAHYQSADAFVLPSFAEGLPVVLMEAMALGVPCVTTHITGVPELITDGVDGLLVAPSDRDGLAAAITCLMENPAMARALAVAGRSRILSSYCLSGSIDRLAEIFIQRLSSSDSGRMP